MQEKTFSWGTLAAYLLLAVFVLGMMPACNKWVPPTDGACNDGREWVEPHQEGRRWYDGYCRDVE